MIASAINRLEVMFSSVSYLLNKLSSEGVCKLIVVRIFIYFLIIIVVAWVIKLVLSAKIPKQFDISSKPVSEIIITCS